MSYRIVVLAKQVPDTRNVGKDAMKADGTVNRAALPAIFNPEDLNALEMALSIKDQLKDATVTVITMGPSRAADIIRESIYRGADNGYLVSGRAFAGSDTLATSYAISMAVRKLGKVDLVLSGRQAIDGDTAQVGPQVAEKLEIPQITYAEEVVSVSEDSIQIKRRLERGIEVVECKFPVLITVHGSAPACRFRQAKRVMQYKKACTPSEQQEHGLDYSDLWNQKPYLKIEEWTAEDLNPEMDRLGMSGSPTKVKNIENVVLTQKESVVLSSKEEEINDLMKELIATHIIG
ncbi:MAG: electron transfer flavoprotein subunit beta/FixA family protein [Bacteroidales bacterium]|nr:electron transfer flavoprotein subunit beta/FixA family protein [Bacteroidales bacterium]